MGFTVSGLTDYTKEATELLRKSILLNDDMARYSLQTGIFYKEYLNFIEMNAQVQATDCGLPSSGSTTFSEKEIEVAKYSFNIRNCTEDLKRKDIPQTSGTFNGLDASLEATMTEIGINDIKKQIEKDLWQGTSGMIDGWLANLSGATGAISLDTYSGVTATKDNIDDIVNDFIDNITDAMWARGELVLHMSLANYNLYKRNRIANDLYRDKDNELGKFEMYVLGYEGMVRIKAEAGLNGSNYMILTWDRNLYIGTDEFREISSAKWVVDEVTNYIWFKVNFKLGTQIAFTNEVIHNMY